jgi:eukaryotic-like serine/threonine-protein kinase
VTDLMEEPRLEQLRAALGERYEIERLLGEGGMATVYLARDRRHGRVVALKVLREELAATVGAQRFLQEVHVAASLQHPHILPLYDSGEAHGVLYYVMPWIEGESLRDRLMREERLPMDDAVRIAREAGEGLAYAHRQGVIHRDVKPENVLLQDDHTLIADFGIARAASMTPTGKLTRSGVTVGTPEYMSPEQAAGEAQLDGRSDVYSLGCVLYELLAGLPPFQGRSATTLLARHSLEQVPSLTIVRTTIPPALEETVLRALAKSAADRPSMAEFVDTLRQLEAELPKLPPATTGRRPKDRRRRGRWFPTIAITAVAMLLATWASLALRHPAPRTASVAGPAALDPRQIAVLYFDQRPQADSLEYLADGITEELIHELSGIPVLHVISRNGVAPYRGVAVTPESIGRALHVGTLVHGTVNALGDRIQLGVSLIDAASGTEIDHTTFERPKHQILALQSDLASQVAVFLRRRLGEEVELREDRARSLAHNPRAWHLFQHAEELSRDVDPLLAAGDTAGAAGRLLRADSLLTQAEAGEPRWVRPVVARGWLDFKELDLVGTFSRAHYQRWTARGLGEAERALALDSTSTDAFELRGTLRYYRWFFNLAADSTEAAALLAGAEADLQRAADATPPAAFGLTLLSHLLMAESRTAEGKLAALRAYEADPYLANAERTIWRLFQASLDLGDAPEARRWCAEGQRRFPRYYRFTECRLWLFAFKDQPPDVSGAWRLYRSYLEFTPPNLRVLNRHYGRMLVAIALARADLRDSALATARRARADSTVDVTRDLAMLEAIVHNLLGQRTDALDDLEVYYGANPQLRAGMRRDETWWWKDLREDPRWKGIAAQGGTTGGD